MRRFIESLIFTLLYLIITIILFRVLYNGSLSGESGMAIIVLLFCELITGGVMLIIYLMFSESILKNKMTQIAFLLFCQLIFEISFFFIVDSVCLFGIFDKDGFSLKNIDFVFSLTSILGLLIANLLLVKYKKTDITYI